MHGIPVLVDDRRQPDLLELVTPVEALVAEVGHPSQFSDGRVDVPERQKGQGNEAFRVDAAPLHLEVVEGADAGQRQVLVQVHERPGKETEQVGVEDLGRNAVAVHDPEAGLGVPSAGIGFLEAGGGGGEELLPPGVGLVLDAENETVADQPAVPAPFLVPDHTRGAVKQLSRQPARPEVGRLGDVAVHIDDGDQLAHGFPRPGSGGSFGRSSGSPASRPQTLA